VQDTATGNDASSRHPTLTTQTQSLTLTDRPPAAAAAAAERGAGDAERGAGDAERGAGDADGGSIDEVVSTDSIIGMLAAIAFSAYKLHSQTVGCVMHASLSYCE